jgi:hypothetical protein
MGVSAKVGAGKMADMPSTTVRAARSRIANAME